MKIARIDLNAKHLAVLLAALSFSTQIALADGDNMQKGISEYLAGKYSDALGDFQSCLSNDSQNAKLHYHLANTFIKLNRRDAGIREYRIAYALEPDRDVGKMAMKALVYMGAEIDPAAKQKEAAEAEPIKPLTDPRVDKANASLQQQADQAKILNKTMADTMAAELEKRNQDTLNRTKTSIQQDLTVYRRGRFVQFPMSDDAIKQLDNLKQVYDTQKQTYQEGGSKRSEDIQKSAENLQGLMGEKGKPGSPRLIPEGTNLYIRNYYEPDTKSASKTEVKTDVKGELKTDPKPVAKTVTK